MPALRTGVSKQGLIDAVAGAPAYTGSFKFYLTAGLAADAVPSVTSAPVLYNPGVPTVVSAAWFPLVTLRIVRVSIGVVSGTLVAGSLQYGLAKGVTFTLTSTTGGGKFNTFFGRGAATSALWYTAATASVAPSCMPSGLDAGGDMAAGVLFNLTDKVGGAIVLPPGAAFWPLLGNGAGVPNLTALVTVDVVQTPMLDRY